MCLFLNLPGESLFQHRRSLPTAISHCVSHGATLLSQQHFAISESGGAETPAKELGQPSGGSSFWPFLRLKTSFFPLLHRSTASLLFSDACDLACANELFQRGPGLKCQISCRIFLLTASKLAECKQQGTKMGQAG